MVDVELGDILAVLQLLAPYLIAIAVVVIAAIVITIRLRREPKPARGTARGFTWVAAVLAIALIANLMAIGPMSTLLTLSSGTGEVSAETTDKALQSSERVADEGIVLLKNDGLLPLSQKKVNLFGWASVSPVYSGAGSGSISKDTKFIDLNTGLANAGIESNKELTDFYKSYSSARPEMSIQKQSWTLPEPPTATYPKDLLTNAKSYSDVAIIILSRAAGEGHTDMPTDVTKVKYDNNSKDYADFEPGQHYLQLSRTEQDMVDLVTSNFEKVIVVYNAANPFELGFVDKHPQIKSVVWAGGPGNNGFNSLGRILSGAVNPSGHAADTFVYDMKATPWWNNQTKRNYTNMTQLGVDGMNAGKPEKFFPSFINYTDGIYVGYKFYETAAAEGAIDYDRTVQFPFGHGLSYTTFTQKMSDIKVNGKELSFEVSVTNTGKVAGKDVVQVYSNPPYTDGGIEKSAATLVAFEKTPLLKPGATHTVSIKVELSDLASYDMRGTGGYVLEAGDYELSVRADSHVVLDKRVHKVTDTVRYDEKNPRNGDKTPAKNLFAAVAGDVTYLSRAQKFANLKSATAAPTNLQLSAADAAKYHTNATFDAHTYDDPKATMPTTGAKNGIKLQELRGATYDDPRWEKLLDELTVDEMVKLTALAGYQTAGVDSVGKIRTVDSDGPAAINNNFTQKGSVGYPVAVMIASTFNKELAHEYGKMMGLMSRELGSAGWYAPAMNTHRVAFGARNYEYYSEDGVLAGEIASGAIQGATTEGVYSYIKHFALYDTNGKMVSIWANEQSMRETYLRPFELSVKEGKATAVMVAWNYLGTKWVGEWSELNKNVLRDEWGFQGLVITDFFRNNGHGFMTADMALANGVDGMLSTFEGGPNKPTNPNSASTVTYLRHASKNFMYTTVNSWVHDPRLDTGGTPAWKKQLVGIDIAVLAALAVATYALLRRRKHATVATAPEASKAGTEQSGGE